MQPITISVSTGHFVLERHGLSPLLIDRVDGSLTQPPPEEIQHMNLGPPRTVCGILGVIRVHGDAYLIVLNHFTRVAAFQWHDQLREIYQEDISRFLTQVNDVEFISFLSGTGTAHIMKQETRHPNLPCSLYRLLVSGLFYASDTLDLTLHFQRSGEVGARTVARGWGASDLRFFWNYELVKVFLSAGLDAWVFPLVQGHVELRSLPSCGGHGEFEAQLLLVSRRSKWRAGTRFLARGLDDEGNAANFVETEQVLLVGSRGAGAGSGRGRFLASFLQTRGSVPVFWEEQISTVDLKNLNLRNISKGMGKANRIQLSRPPEATAHAFALHFREQLRLYGIQVVVNLLSLSKPGEALLVQHYQNLLQQLRSPDIKYVYWDFHEYCKGKNFANVQFLLQKLETDLEMLEFHLEMRREDASSSSSSSSSSSGSSSWPPTQQTFFGPLLSSSSSSSSAGSVASWQVLKSQRGTFRTNCKDCLDRTNLVQSLVGWRALLLQWRRLHELDPTFPPAPEPEVQALLADMWANNGDSISLAYAGTGAIKSHLTRTGHSNFISYLEDHKRSFERYLKGVFTDQAKQEAIEQLLGLHASVSPFYSQRELRLQAQLEERAALFTAVRPAHLFATTYNVNGVLPERHPPRALEAWLRTPPEERPAVYLIGLQEVVQLTANKVLQTDPRLGRVWREALGGVLDAVWGPGEFLCLGSHQLIGLLVLLFAHRSQVEHLRDVEVDCVKAGLQGLAGNKGANAIRFSLQDTQVLCINAHLTAGQKKLQQRNMDWQLIESTIFQAHRPRTPDIVFWLGDFNYRIDLPAAEAKALAQAGQLDRLLAHDQFLAQRSAGAIFQGYSEGPIAFPPTYKYDPGTDTYDTSSKQRVPAWCDRVLWRARPHLLAPPTLLEYRRFDDDRASDHRAVIARFRIHIHRIIPERRQMLAKLLSDPPVEEKARLSTLLAQPIPAQADEVIHANPVPLLGRPAPAPVPCSTTSDDEFNPRADARTSRDRTNAVSLSLPSVPQSAPKLPSSLASTAPSSVPAAASTTGEAGNAGDGSRWQAPASAGAALRGGGGSGSSQTLGLKSHGAHSPVSAPALLAVPASKPEERPRSNSATRPLPTPPSASSHSSAGSGPSPVQASLSTPAAGPDSSPVPPRPATSGSEPVLQPFPRIESIPPASSPAAAPASASPSPFTFHLPSAPTSTPSVSSSSPSTAPTSSTSIWHVQAAPPVLLSSPGAPSPASAPTNATSDHLSSASSAYQPAANSGGYVPPYVPPVTAYPTASAHTQSYFPVQSTTYSQYVPPAFGVAPSPHGDAPPLTPSMTVPGGSPYGYVVAVQTTVSYPPNLVYQSGGYAASTAPSTTHHQHHHSYFANDPNFK